MVTGDRWCGEGELGGSQKVQRSNYKIISTRDVKYNMINILNTNVCYIRKRKFRVPFTRKKIFFFFSFVSIWDDG